MKPFLLLLGRLTFILLLIWAAGLVWFVTRMPAAPVVDETPTDAIVVLTGGSLRLEYGLSLIEQGKGKMLFVSGVGKGVKVHELVRAAGKDAAKLPADAVIMLGYDANDTHGNALETARLVHKENLNSLRLVTASYHIPRSVLEFRLAMPDVTIVQDPVFPDNFRREAWWKFPGTMVLTLSEYHKYVAVLARYYLS